MHSLDAYREQFLQHLEKSVTVKEPAGLYEPVHHILKMGGKRMRPILTLMIADILGEEYKKALDAAVAVELFHNFTLIHDDIMDNAPLRRGQPTIHEQWNLNTGILSGDVTLVMAYRFLESYPPEIFRELSILLNSTAITVCEGQQYDLDFETRDNVTIPEYLTMIEYKTAVLLGAAMKMGAIIAGASRTHTEAVYNFGLNLGMAFQLKDDYLDTFGDTFNFGKKVGGDILKNKKTFLYLKTLQCPYPDVSSRLREYYSGKPFNEEDKIEGVRRLFAKAETTAVTRMEIENYTQLALSFLKKMELSEEKYKTLKDFANQLMVRTA